MASPPTGDWRTPAFDDLCDALLAMRDRAEMAALLRDVCTIGELEALSHRLAAARLLQEGLPYTEIAQRVGGSTTTITRVAHWLRHGEGGYGLALERLGGADMTDRGLVRLALPSKGRMAEPAAQLLHDAGISFVPGGRTLHTRCLDLDLELLFARSDDIPVWVADGGVDVGITGRNQVVETGVDVEELLELDFGACRLALAVPDGSPVRDAAGLAGLRVATSYPGTLRGELARRGIDATVVQLTGSVELAPRLHAADAVADLVSSGETLRQNGLREIGTLLDSRAVLIGRRDLAAEQRLLIDEIVLLLGSVLDARPKRYLMLNARDETLDDVLALLPSMDAPTVLPLSREGMHAVHAVIDAGDVVRLLGPLRAAGASSLLVLPIEHLIP